MAEEVRFELTNGFPLPVFKTGAFSLSATPPVVLARLILRQHNNRVRISVKHLGWVCRKINRFAKVPIKSAISTTFIELKRVILSFLFFVIAMIASAFGACVRFAMMEYGRVSVVLVNAMASLAIGACVAWFGMQTANQPMARLAIWGAFGFLAGFSTVFGQVGWVYQRGSCSCNRSVLLLGLVRMAAGFGWLGYGAVLWLK